MWEIPPGFAFSYAVAAFAFRVAASEGWSGREDLNAPKAHKPPWRLALPASGGLRLDFQLIKPLSALAGFKKALSIPGF